MSRLERFIEPARNREHNENEGKRERRKGIRLSVWAREEVTTKRSEITSSERPVHFFELDFMYSFLFASAVGLINDRA